MLQRVTGKQAKGKTITVTTTEATASSFGANAEVFVSGATGGYMVVNSISSEDVDGVTTYTIVLENKMEGTSVAIQGGTSVALAGPIGPTGTGLTGPAGPLVTFTASVASDGHGITGGNTGTLSVQNQANAAFVTANTFITIADEANNTNYFEVLGSSYSVVSGTTTFTILNMNDNTNAEWSNGAAVALVGPRGPNWSLPGWIDR